VPPPQSTSVSAPFFIASVQVGASAPHTPPAQLALWQSPALPHAFPFGHLAQAGPPQSTSLSLPFFIPSLQAPLGAAQTPFAQLALVQSEATPQVLPLAHLTQVAPPQSMSVSPPFFIPSLHVGAGALQTLPTQLAL
jgi:hypothetical protein